MRKDPPVSKHQILIFALFGVISRWKNKRFLLSEMVFCNIDR